MELLHEQACDGASNMLGWKNSVAKLIKEI